MMLPLPKLPSLTVGFAILSLSFTAACNNIGEGPILPVAKDIPKAVLPMQNAADTVATEPMTSTDNQIPKVDDKTPVTPTPTTPAPVVSPPKEFGNLTAVSYYGVGLTGRVKSLLGTNLNSSALTATQNGVYVYGCIQTAEKLWKSAGILVENGRLHGIELDFTGENCTEFDSSLEDSTSISLIDLQNAFRPAGIYVSKNTESFIFTLPNGTTFELTKLPIVLPPVD